MVIAEAEGAWVTDVEGRRYLDCLAAYSAVNFGHRHPVVVEAARRQLDRVTLVSRAFYSDQLGTFSAELAALCGKEMVLPMNTGAEAVESGIKVARKWGRDVKGIRNPNIVVAAGNFHGRTTTIISFSDDPEARAGFGPYTPGFRTVPYGDADAVAAAVDDDTVAVLVEPIQGEAGVVVPPADYLPRLRALCTRASVLLVCDEIQSGLGRTGRTFACDHVGVEPDLYLLGKALGGGVVPVSAVVGDRDGARGAAPRAARVDVRRQPAGGRGGHRRGPRCWPPASTSDVPRSWAGGCTGGWTRWSVAASSRCAGSGCGPGSTWIRGWPRAARSASGWPSVACWPRTPTAPPSGSPHRWW